MIQFTFKAYFNLLMTIINSGYTFVGYEDYQISDKVCILRHDVDFDLFKAAEFATKEREFFVDLGINGRSMFFILLSCNFYNIASKTSRTAIEQIVESGADIGLHFDQTVYNNDTKHITDAVEFELDIMRRLTHLPIKAVSMHMPSQELLRANLVFRTAKNSYGSEFFEGFKYLSDSRMHWREPVIDIIQSGHFRKLHILTHPIWYDNYDLSTREKVLQLVHRAEKRYSDDLEINTLGEFLGNREPK